MTRLVIAVGDDSRRSIEEMLHEHTAGRWRRWVNIKSLQSGKKHENDAEIYAHATEHREPMFVSAHLTSEYIEAAHPHVMRLTKDKLQAAAIKWLSDRRLTWYSTLTVPEPTGFRVGDSSEWRGQFKRVSPKFGPRVAKALLAQVRIIGIAELADTLVGGEDFDHNVHFFGSDPHSGDFALVGPLASRIDGDKLSEAMELPQLPAGSRVRLFLDGGWSGGEAERRVQCLTTKCTRKTSHIGPEHSLTVRFGCLTDVAQARLDSLRNHLGKEGRISELHVSCAPENLLEAGKGTSSGLAFADQALVEFVDPVDSSTFRAVCKMVGDCLAENRSLGTASIASTIAFEHSLPKAMLPMFIFGDKKVVDADGKEFTWKALFESRHVLKPAKNRAAVHCDDCPLNKGAKKLTLAQ